MYVLIMIFVSSFLAQQAAAGDYSTTLMITSNPSDAKVWLDGVFEGNTPVRITGKRPGEHYLAIEHPDYQPWRGLVLLKPGVNNWCHADLVKWKRVDELLSRLETIDIVHCYGVLLVTNLVLLPPSVLGIKVAVDNHWGSESVAPLAAGLMGIVGIFTVTYLDIWQIADLRRLLCEQKSLYQELERLSLEPQISPVGVRVAWRF